MTAPTMKALPRIPRNCPWYLRWWHRRLRRADVRFMGDLVYTNVQRWLQAHPESTQSSVELFNEAWGEFVAARGQEHWRCGCAHADWIRVHGEHYPW